MFDRISSTNQEAKRQAESGADHGTIIIANSQTNGKGRKGRSFYSPADSGIYLSIILRPLPKAEDTMLITSAAAVAVAKAIEEVAKVSAQIKWVNDIFINGKKVCGILTEAVTNLESGEIETIILGIGINVTTVHFPDDLSKIAASISNKYVSRNYLIASVCNYLDEIYTGLPAKSFLSEYKSRSFVLGKEIQVIKGDRISHAKAIDLNEQAHLIVEYPDKTREALSSGEISIKRLP